MTDHTNTHTTTTPRPADRNLWKNILPPQGVTPRLPDEARIMLVIPRDAAFTSHGLARVARENTPDPITQLTIVDEMVSELDMVQLESWMFLKHVV